MTSIPASRRAPRLVSDPGLVRLSIPVIVTPSMACCRLLARLLPTNPQMPVIRMRMSGCRRHAPLPSVHDFLEGLLQRTLDPPIGVVGAHLTEIRVIANVIADTVLIDVLVRHPTTRDRFGDLEGLEHRARIVLTA